MLDEYLNSLEEDEKEKTATQARFGAASVTELAKLAGIKLAEDVCTNCGDTMEKAGSILKCGCGMMKKAVDAAEEEHPVDPGYVRGVKGTTHAMTGKPGGWINKPEVRNQLLKGQLNGFGMGAGVGGALGASAGALLGKKNRLAGAGLGALLGGGAGGLTGQAAGGESALRDYLRSKGIHRSGAFIPSHRFTEEAAEQYLPKEGSSDFIDKLAELIELNGGDLEKTTAVLEECGMDKEAIWGALSGVGKGLAAGAKALGKGQVGRAGKAVAGGLKRTGRQLKQTYEAGRRGAGGMGPAVGGAGGVLRGAKAVAKANPALAVGAGAAGAAGLGGAGYMMGKSGSALMEVGDAAGRMLAKTAEGEPTMGSAPIPLDEIRESIQEAQSREDIPGRAKRWQIGGGAGGGVMGGAAGYGAGRLIGPKAGLLGAGLGAAGGALGGQHLGKQHGAEEARADKAVAMLRALRAHQAGSMRGFGAGMQRGYSMGRGPVGQEKAASIVKRLSR